MPRVIANMVDAYVFRRHRGRLEFLLLKRAESAPLGGTWHGIHGEVDERETAVEAVRRLARQQAAITDITIYSADYVNEFFDHLNDAIILAPVFALETRGSVAVALDPEFGDYAWCDREEATGRLTFANQRWAVRHIEDLLAQVGPEADLYRIS